jgi:hypothetical protein
MTHLGGQGHVTVGVPIITGRVYSSQQQASGTGLQPAPADSDTVMGVARVENTIEIRESEAIADKVRLYNAFVNGKEIWSGAGDDRVDALLEAIQAATSGGGDVPNN